VPCGDFFTASNQEASLTPTASFACLNRVGNAVLYPGTKATPAQFF
jgi:hypothetical protein